MAVLIKGTGSSLPSRIVSNDEISTLVETSDEWIRERTGIEQRHISTGESVAELAIEAAKRALESAKVTGDNIEIILVASCSSEMALPCVACQVQDAIGARKAVAFDLNAACSGFLFALNTINAYFRAGIYKNALIIGAEVLSNIIDWRDRGTCILFGDGAGAVYLENDISKDNNISFIQGSDGSMGAVLSCVQRDNKNAFYEGEELTKYVSMDGREVYRFATRKVPSIISELLEKEKTEADLVDLFLLHQANIRIVEGIAKKLGQDMSKFPVNVDRVGNTSSASIPILLDEVYREGRIKEGMKIVMSGFGAGLTFGACMLKM